MKFKITMIILALLFGASISAQHVIPENAQIQGDLEVRKDQNDLTALRITNANTSGYSWRGLVIGNGTQGHSLQLFSTPENYTLFPAWKDAAIINVENELSSLIVRSATGRIRFQPNSLEDRIVFDENGNVGIGTDTPNANLEIYKYNGSSKLRLHTNQHAGTAVLEIAGGSAFLDSNPDNYSGWSIYHSYNSTNRDLYFRHGESGNPDVIFADNGNVGIGTNSPDYKLEVNGIIRSKELICEATDWPDYVFEDNYHPLTLYEIEQHIAEKGHLPKVPSAEEVHENGITLGEMNALLLEKIEELTMHTIQQQKQLDKQQRLIEELLEKEH